MHPAVLDWLQFISGREGFSFSLEQLNRLPHSICKLVAAQVPQSRLIHYIYINVWKLQALEQGAFVSRHCTQPRREAHREHP